MWSETLVLLLLIRIGLSWLHQLLNYTLNPFVFFQHDSLRSSTVSVWRATAVDLLVKFPWWSHELNDLLLTLATAALQSDYSSTRTILSCFGLVQHPGCYHLTGYSCRALLTRLLQRCFHRFAGIDRLCCTWHCKRLCDSCLVGLTLASGRGSTPT